jgi:DNA replicative helicase MCM subunit Mcm2 (Cdc46/Mcm family)
LIEHPAEFLLPFEEALDDIVRASFPKYLQETEEVHIGFTGR